MVDRIVAEYEPTDAGFDQSERHRTAEAADADDERRLGLERIALRT